MRRSISILCFLAGILPSTLLLNAQNGYNIEITVNGLSDTTVILGHHLGKAMLPDDTVRVNEAGYGVLTGDEALEQGLYFIFFPNGSWADIVVGTDQSFSLTTDTTNYSKNLKVAGSEEIEIFLNFQGDMFEKRSKIAELQERHGSAESDKEKEKIIAQIKKIDEDRIGKVEKIVEDHPDMFLATFLTATTEVEVPENIKSNQHAAYLYYKKHYFDNFDLSDPRLVYTPFYEDKVMRYLDKVVPQIPDSLIMEVDAILDKAQTDSLIFQFLLPKLFNKYAKSKLMGMDAVLVHIAEKYFIPHAWWSSEKFVADLKERVSKIKPLLLGEVAPDVQLRYVPSDHFKQAANDTALKKYPHAGSFFNISDIDADYTVLVFWESHCSHCKKVIPKLYEMYQDTLQSMNVKVVAISTLGGEDGKIDWINYVNSKQTYDWINAWNPYSYEYKEDYDIRSTPQIFVLNKNKEIIGKKLGPENILELIEAYKNIKVEE